MQLSIKSIGEDTLGGRIDVLDFGASIWVGCAVEGVTVGCAAVPWSPRVNPDTTDAEILTLIEQILESIAAKARLVG